MSAIPAPSANRESKPPKLPTEKRLENGDSLDQKTFHELYKSFHYAPKAELIGGQVFFGSPVTFSHGETHGTLITWVGYFARKTSGTTAACSVTNILGPKSEPRPDAVLILRPETGGQTHLDENKYLVGPPELIVEIATSHAAIDHHLKSQDYEKAGVQEYIIVTLPTRQVEWYAQGKTGFISLKPTSDGILKSRVFPGLWLDPTAIVQDEIDRVFHVLQQGLASDEHAKFVKKLQTKMKRKK